MLESEVKISVESQVLGKVEANGSVFSSFYCGEIGLVLVCPYHLEIRRVKYLHERFDFPRSVQLGNVIDSDRNRSLKHRTLDQALVHLFKVLHIS